MRRHGSSLAAALFFAGGALAHDLPVNPSTCVDDALALEVPAARLAALVTPPAPGNPVRVVYSVATSTAQFQQPGGRSRPMTIGSASGAVALPVAFDATLLDSGDLSAEGVTLLVTVGGASVAASVTLTSAVATRDGVTVAGRPLDAAGEFELVGVVPAGVLPAPFAAEAAVVRFGCGLRPVPAADRFAPAPSVDAISGSLSATAGRLRAVVRGGPPVASLVGVPVAFQIAAAGEAIATLELPGGFAARAGRRWVAETPEGDRLTLRPGAGDRPARLEVRLGGMRMPAASGPVTVRVTLVAGALTARGGRPFRARNGVLRAGS